MKRICTIFFLTIIISVFSVGHLLAQQTIWPVGTARTVPKYEAEFGIIYPFRYGITDRTEISTSPLLLLSLSPNISIKHRWIEGNILVASKHSFNNPTLLLEAFSETGIFNLMPDSINAPFIYSFWNEGIVSYRFAPEQMISARAGFRFALKTGQSNLPVVQRPFFYQRASIYHNKFLWYIGVGVDGNLYEDINYSADIDFLSVGAGVDFWAIEHKGMLIWNKSVKFAALAGYYISIANYPKGTDFGILPMLDFIWKINKKKKRLSKGLWRK